MRIAFCDDDFRLIDLLCNYAKAWAEETGSSVECSSFTTSEDFLLAWTSPTMFDVIFLDIKMQKLSGLELARIVRNINESVPLVFITAYSEYALDGYQVNAARYLLKPVSRETFFECMGSLSNKMTQPKRKTLLVEKGGTTIKLPYDELLYLEARSHLVVAFTTKGAVEFRARISDLEQQLSVQDGFVRIHRSFLVNLALVREMSRTEVLTETGERLPVSRSYAREAFNEYIRNGR